MPAAARNGAFILVDGESPNKYNHPLYDDVFGVLPKMNVCPASNPPTLHADGSQVGGPVDENFWRKPE